MSRVQDQHPDKNLRVNINVDTASVQFFDVREQPFGVYGLYNYKSEPAFKRMPSDVANAVSEGVGILHTNTAGGRVRFCTDSRKIVIRAKMPSVTHFPHMPLSGSSGFDLYIDDPNTKKSTFHRTFMPPHEMSDGYTSEICFKTDELRYFTIHFPCYNDISELHIGLDTGAKLGKGLEYLDVPPIVYYGSSITQGGCCSRPGNCYSNAISRNLGVDHVNLGFSGNAKAEPAMCEYLASLNASVFVCDYDHNTPSAEHLRNTHYKLYESVRAAHPTLPYIMISRPDYRHHDDSPERKRIIMQSFKRARAAGDENVYFIDGSKFFKGDMWDSCTVDSTHPNDLGFYFMTRKIGRVIAQILNIE
jgi:hypothetical protein